MMVLTKINPSWGQLLLMMMGNYEVITNGLMMLGIWEVKAGQAVGDTVVAELPS